MCNFILFLSLIIRARSLDEILDGGGLARGTLLEIFGLSTAGKTQLCNTIALNLARQQHKCVYLDVGICGGQFSATRLYRMLSTHKTVDRHILDRICMQPIQTFDDLLETLQKFICNSAVYDHLYDVLVVDSMAAIWQLYDRSERDEGRLFDLFYRMIIFVNDFIFAAFAQLVRTTQLLRTLAGERNKIILLVNSGYRKLESAGNGGCDQKEIIKPLLGKCWESVPDVRLLIERLDDESDEKWRHCRRIRIVRSSFQAATSPQCRVTITNAGIV